MYMDDIKVCEKNEKELETLMQTIRTYSQDTGMEFGIEKCAILIMISAKRETVEGIELQNSERIRTLGEKENYKYLGILEEDTSKQSTMMEKKKRND